jgi:hypothetical protein
VTMPLSSLKVRHNVNSDAPLLKKDSIWYVSLTAYELTCGSCVVYRMHRKGPIQDMYISNIRSRYLLKAMHPTRLMRPALMSCCRVHV